MNRSTLGELFGRADYEHIEALNVHGDWVPLREMRYRNDCIRVYWRETVCEVCAERWGDQTRPDAAHLEARH